MSVSLTYGSETVTLPSPDFNDSEDDTFGNVFGSNRNGELLNVDDAGQPAITTRVWTIKGMTKTERDDLEHLLFVSAGDALSIVDYNGNSFSALVTNEDVELITLRDDCNYQVTLQLMEIS